MKIETRFEIGQPIVYLSGSKLTTDIVHSIGIDVSKETKIQYFFNNDGEYTIVEECNIFTSKEDFLNQLEDNCTEKLTV